MYKRLLVPTDGSALSTKAVRNAVELAAALGAEVVALHVVPRYPTSFFEGGTNVPADAVARAESASAAHGQELVDEVVAAARAAGVDASAWTVRSDHVGEALLAAARKHRCDLVVMASHGRTGWKRMLLGSETQHVLTLGDLPVLVLR